MPIQKIQFGSNASSSLLNDNFDYLQGEVIKTNEYVVNMNTELDAKIDLINGTVESQLKTFQEQLNTSLDDVSKPDMTAGESIAIVEGGYTFKTNGWLYAYLTSSAGYTQELKLDSKTVAHNYQIPGDGRAGTLGIGFWLYCTKGQVLTGRADKLEFYPIKENK